jgi:hypothetical protein
MIIELVGNLVMIFSMILWPAAVVRLAVAMIEVNAKGTIEI